MKKNLAFIVAVSNNLVYAAGNIAIALNRYMTIDYDLFVYTQNVSESDKKVLNDIPHTQVVEYSFEPGFINFMLNKLPENCRFKDEKKLMRFCHYETFKLLDRYRYAVWIDCDMSIQRDISDIISYGPFAMTKDTPWLVKDQFIKPVSGFNMEKEAYCSGIMMMEDTIPYNEIYNWLFDNTKKYASYMKNGDQAIINLMIQQFDLEPNAMPLYEYQCISGRPESISARVVHFGTDKKVWNDKYTLDSHPEWYRVYLEWIEMGGSKSDDINELNPQNALWDISELYEKCNRLQNDNNEEKAVEKLKHKSDRECVEAHRTSKRKITSPLRKIKRWMIDVRERLIHIEGKVDKVLSEVNKKADYVKKNTIDQDINKQLDTIEDLSTKIISAGVRESYRLISDELYSLLEKNCFEHVRELEIQNKGLHEKILKYIETEEKYERYNSSIINSEGDRKILIALPDSENESGAYPELEQLYLKFIHNNKNNPKDFNRLYMTMLNIRKVIELQIPGAFAELGVYKGNFSSILAYYANKTNRDLYLFDTFSGFDANDFVGVDKNQTIKNTDTSLDYVKQNVGDEENIHYYQGYFPDTLTQETKDKKYAFVSLDADLYKPILAGLEFFYPRLSNGGMIFVHDYSSGYYEGATLAVNEFCKKNGTHLVLMPDKSGTAVIIR